MNKSIMFFVIWLLCGVIFFAFSSFGLNAMPDKEEMIEITGVITDIEVEGTGDDKTHKVFVEYEIDNQIYEEKLSYYSSSFRVGKEITLYYEEGKTEKVYAEGEESFLKLFRTISVVISVFGLLGIGYSICKERGII